MSYRVKIDGCQIFGNNESYALWDDFVKSQGITIDTEGNYDGYTTDVEGMFKVIDKITRKNIADRHRRVLAGEKKIGGKEAIKELADFTDSIFLKDDTPILEFDEYIARNAYIFLPLQVKNILMDKIVRADDRYKDDIVDWSFASYKLKDGEKIHLSAS